MFQAPEIVEPSERIEEEVETLDIATPDAPTTAGEQPEMLEKEEDPVIEEHPKLEEQTTTQALQEETAESNIELPEPDPEPDPVHETELELEQEPETEATSSEQPEVQPEPEEPETEAASSEQPEVEPETEES